MFSQVFVCSQRGKGSVHEPPDPHPWPSRQVTYPPLPQKDQARRTNGKTVWKDKPTPPKPLPHPLLGMTLHDQQG